VFRKLPGIHAASAMTFREFLDACKAATGSDAEFVWIPQDFLHQHQLETDSALGIPA